jgi:hypothetical protein
MYCQSATAMHPYGVTAYLLATTIVTPLYGQAR